MPKLSHDPVTVFAVVAVALATLFQIYWIIQPLPFLIDTVFERDDAFYYFVIARNFAQTGQASFDGLHLSNGVQLLWHYILSGIAWTGVDKITYLRVILWLCVALNVLVAALLWGLGRKIHSSRLGAIMAIFWAGVMVERWNTLQGMEFSLHIAVAILCLSLLWTIAVARDMRRVVFFWLGACLTICFWSRLDGAVFSLAIWCVVAGLIVIREPKFAARASGWIALGIVPALGLIGYIAANESLGGTPLPLSGTVKEIYAHRFFDGVEPARIAIEQLGWWIKTEVVIALALIPSNLLHINTAVLFNPMSQPLQMALPVALGLISVLGLWRIYDRYGWSSREARVAGFAFAICGVAAIHLAIVIWKLADFSHVTRHYYGWLLIFWLIWGGLLLMMLLEALPKLLRQVAGGGLCAVWLMAYGIMGYQFVADYPEGGLENHALIRMGIAGDLNETLPQDAIVGAWNAGALGFFLDRPVVNLDGLVNDENFADLLEADAPLGDYFKTTGITHLIDHNGRDLTLAYQEKRDLEGEFRDGITWDTVEVLDKVEDIYILRVK